MHCFFMLLCQNLKRERSNMNSGKKRWNTLGVLCGLQLKKYTHTQIHTGERSALFFHVVMPKFKARKKQHEQRQKKVEYTRGSLWLATEKI